MILGFLTISYRSKASHATGPVSFTPVRNGKETQNHISKILNSLCQ